MMWPWEPCPGMHATWKQGIGMVYSNRLLITSMYSSWTSQTNHRKKALVTHISKQYTSVSAEPRLDLLFRCSEAQTRPGNTENSTFDWRFEHRLMHYHIVVLMGVAVFILSANIVRKLLESLYNRGILSQFLVNSIVKSEVFTSGSSVCPRTICPQECKTADVYLAAGQSTRTACSLRQWNHALLHNTP